MADPCNHCHGSRLVGWSGAGPILCPECSRGQDAFTVITQAWREQRARVRELEDCGQNGVCALSPGCIRHWQERNRELVTERDQQTLRANRSEAGERDELRAEVIRLSALAYGECERAKELEAELAELRVSAAMACETPPDGCDCAGCSYAAEVRSEESSNG